MKVYFGRDVNSFVLLFVKVQVQQAGPYILQTNKQKHDGLSLTVTFIVLTMETFLGVLNIPGSAVF